MSKASKNRNKHFLGSYKFWLPLGICFVVVLVYLLWGKPLGAAAVLGTLLGVWIAWGLNKFYSDQHREDEYRSLLVSFVHELEEDYHRCVLYHKQRQGRIISFSAIFDFNDASTLSRLASVTDNPKIIDAIMYLKKIYFQVGRHVENASKFATELESIKSKISKYAVSPEDQAEKSMLQIKASEAQDMALAFFTGDSNDNITYPKIVDSTRLLIKELKEKWSAKAAKEFQSRFKENRDVLRYLENKKRSRKTLTKDEVKEKVPS